MSSYTIKKTAADAFSENFVDVNFRSLSLSGLNAAYARYETQQWNGFTANGLQPSRPAGQSQHPDFWGNFEPKQQPCPETDQPLQYSRQQSRDKLRCGVLPGFCD